MTEPAVPLFRARMIGLGFEPDRRLVLLELRERAEDDDEDEAAVVPVEDGLPEEGYVARIFATRAGSGDGGAGSRGGGRRASALPALQLPDGPCRPHLPAVELDPTRASDALRHGEIELLGRMAWSSNATFLATVRISCSSTAGSRSGPSPSRSRGERPLWDFPTAPSCHREVARTSSRRPSGGGSSPRPSCATARSAWEWSSASSTTTPTSTTSPLLPEHGDRFRTFAAFDVLANNADRKGGHCLQAQSDRHVWGIDHGLTFHVVDKLRTVIWDFAGEPVPDGVVATVECILGELDGALGRRLGELLAPAEVQAISDRGRALLRAGTFPVPDEGYHSVPWPLV